MISIYVIIHSACTCFDADAHIGGDLKDFKKSNMKDI